MFGGEGQLCSSCSAVARAEAACMHETSKCCVTVPILSSFIGFHSDRESFIGQGGFEVSLLHTLFVKKVVHEGLKKKSHRSCIIMSNCK